MPEMAPPLLVVCFVVCIFVSSVLSYQFGYAKRAQEVATAAEAAVEDDQLTEIPDDEIPVEMPEHEVTLPPADMMPDMQALYEQNEDIVGWLRVDDMNIDYPVMQTMDDEEYYLNRDFDRNYNMNGCLIMDTDSVVGTGTKANDYADGTSPSTNLIIHGHNMKNGDMFGNLDNYRKEDFYQSHKIIRFNTLYEAREYEIISVFLSQVYLKSQTDVFKYYKFFQANSEEEFADFYDHIMDMALYDTGVEASYGDEFITLSVCAYHVENGRLVVVGKRIR
ncbi:MAG: class B sortase [Lachnospiraceae bacterium]|nr:class B sortase [Lachnospiraceae bacterium]